MSCFFVRLFRVVRCAVRWFGLEGVDGFCLGFCGKRYFSWSREAYFGFRGREIVVLSLAV